MALTIKHRVSLDLSISTLQATVPFRKGDVAAHEVIFGIRNGSEVVELPVGTMALICIYNGANNGAGVSDMCTVDHVNHTISYFPTRDALSVAGSVNCELRIMGTGGTSFGVASIVFMIDDTMASVTEAEIKKALMANDAWGVIQQTVQSANDVAAKLELAERCVEDAAAYSKESKLWANGGTSGDEPTAENNAKYFAKLAADRCSGEQISVISGEVDYMNGDGSAGLIYELDDATVYPGHYAVIGYKCVDNLDVVIPATYRGRAVKEIRANAFKGLSLNTLVVGKNVKTIDKNAFSGSNIKHIIIPWTIDAAPGGAEWGQEGDVICELYGLRFKITNGIASVTGILADVDAEIVIPSKYKNANVTSVSAKAFYGMEKVRKFVLPATVISIGELAFAYCRKLEEINIPTSVTSIGNSAFERCAGIKRIIFDAINCTDLPINNKAFAQTGMLYGEFLEIVVEIGEKVKRIPANLFAPINDNANSTHGIHEVIFAPGSECESIGANAFRYSVYLHKITLPHSLTTIGSEAFRGCERLLEISIPKNVERLELSTFNGCTRLSEVSIPGVKAISSNVFMGCSRLRKIELPEGLTTLGNNVFMNCSKLIDVVLPESLEKLPYYTFSGCAALSHVYLRASAWTIDSYAFQNCKNLDLYLPRPTSVNAISPEAFVGADGTIRVAWALGAVNSAPWGFGGDIQYNVAEE